MKHLKYLFTALLLLCTTSATAHDFEVGGIYYYVTDATNKTVAVTYRGTSYNVYLNEYTGSVVIPQSVTYNGSTYSVTSIGDEAFSCCTGLTSIVIPNSVTSIGDNAFSGCTGLTSIVIPNSVTSIGIYAFSGCTGLTSIEIPNSVTSIGDGTFYDCTGLTSIVIPNSVISIGHYAFYECSGLTSVTIGNSVTSIGSYAFSKCIRIITVINFSELTFSKGSGIYGYIAYYANKVINAPNGERVGYYYFAEINGVKTLCGYIGSNAVITLPDNYKGENYAIGKGAFRKCTGLIRIVIPNSVTSIGDEAFRGCTGLKSVVIPNSVTNIGYRAFYECSGLTSIVIPNSVTSIGDEAFRLCGLTSVTIGNSVTSIGSDAFSGCTGLTSIVIPNSVTSIGNYAFSYCTGLTSVTIGNSVTSIGNYAFESCSGLTSIVIPNSVTSIGNYAFSYCTGLTSLTSHILADKLFVPGSNAFYNIDKTQCTLYVPYGAKEAYASTDGWNDFENIIEMDLTGIDEVNDELKGENGGVKTVYDLNGRVVENPSNGIYIIDGRKVLVQ